MIGKTTVFILMLAAVAVVFAFAPSAAPTAHGQEGAKYLGNKKCMMCHADQTESYNEMKHAHAFDVLSAEQVASGKDDKGRACIQCHTTGYGKGGFESAEKTPNFKNVGCESCHGPGSEHVKTMTNAMMNDTKPADKHIIRKADCTQCHNPHVSYKKLYGSK
jgi:hypothetical protein